MYFIYQIGKHAERHPWFLESIHHTFIYCVHVNIWMSKSKSLVFHVLLEMCHSNQEEIWLGYFFVFWLPPTILKKGFSLCTKYLTGNLIFYYNFVIVFLPYLHQITLKAIQSWWMSGLSRESPEGPEFKSHLSRNYTRWWMN